MVKLQNIPYDMKNEVGDYTHWSKKVGSQLMVSPTTENSLGSEWRHLTIAVVTLTYIEGKKSAAVRIHLDTRGLLTRGKWYH